jgi:tRNA G10  N-methylase Trm11
MTDSQNQTNDPKKQTNFEINQVINQPYKYGFSTKIEKEEVDNLVDRFIQTDPRISKPSKAEFFSPIQMAKKSVEDNDMIVSETLARIYIDQGNIEKAIHIFRKLSLLYPDKNTYFAALILKLEKPDLL